MKFNPTDSQNAAINAQGCVLVSAAAGSGKTAVLVERVIKMLTRKENPVSADRLLIVTFTNAAAKEMLSRIENRLFEKARKNPDDELINRQRYLIKSADICTIDSFCIRLVRDNFSICKIEPDFKVTDDSSLLKIRYEVLESILNEYLKEKSDSLNMLLDLANCRYGESELIKLIDKIYIDSKKKPSPKTYINALKAPYSIPFDSNHIWYKSAFLYANEVLSELKKAVARLAEAALYSENHDKATVFAESVSNLIYNIEESLNSNDWDTVYSVIHSSDIGRAPTGFGDFKKRIVKEFEKIGGMFYAEREVISGEISAMSPAIILLCEIIDTYTEKLFARLKEENIFSFDDVEQLAMSMLLHIDQDGNAVKTEQSSEIISRYDEVLVDEFQDVNDLQNALFEIISDNSKNLFIVGDVKQSIYAFRGSNPDIFLDKKNSYNDYSNNTDNKAQKILLSDNFRSRKGICDTVNYFFENIMTATSGKLIYGDDEKLNNKAKYPQSEFADTDFLVLDKVDDESKDSIIESEANAIADYIKKTMGKGEILRGEDGNLRNAGYGDFCILLATLKEKAGVIANILKLNGIPAKVTDSDFFNSTEIVTLLSLLHIVDNPQNDVFLLRVLMSPLYSFSAGELAEIRVGRKDMSLYSALCAHAQESLKVQRFLSEISEIRNMSCMLTVDEFVAYLIDKTDMMNIFYSLPAGELRAENIMQFMRLSSEYTSNSSGGIYGFLKYIESLPDNSVKPADTNNDGCVKIMSIHRSKGLQFPICIVAGLSTKMNKSDATDLCLFSGELGIGFKYYSKKLLDKTENIGHKILAEENRKRISEERLRLLYVALTRAEEKLCLICCLNNAQNTLLKAAEASDMGNTAIDGQYIKYAENSAQYILAAALMHPDADVLRKAADLKVNTKNTVSRISFEFIDTAKQDTKENVTDALIETDSEKAKRILSNIDYVYPYISLSNIPAKTSVSAMANKAEAEYFAMSDRPSFMEKDKLSASERGTAIHKVMQFIEFKETPDIESELIRINSEKRITDNEMNAVDRKKIKDFFESSIYKRILKSDDVRREMRFLCELPISDYINSELDTDEKFIVQGAVDLCFSENGGVVIVDFKTDRAESMQKLKEAYSSQLDIYATACEKIFGLPVKEKIIYSFHFSDMIDV